MQNCNFQYMCIGLNIVESSTVSEFSFVIFLVEAVWAGWTQGARRWQLSGIIHRIPHPNSYFFFPSPPPVFLFSSDLCTFFFSSLFPPFISFFLTNWESVSHSQPIDANCTPPIPQFRALSDQLYQSPDHHEFVREQIINQVFNHINFVSQLLAVCTFFCLFSDKPSLTA